MKLFDVYPLFDIEPASAKGSTIIDKQGNHYLDFYGGHAVISVGHSHPLYVKALTEQLGKIGFYSNAVEMPMQLELAHKLGKVSDYSNYQLFLCNSGTEANENALKLASFHNGRKKIVAIKNSFHGRTSLSVGVTDDPKISASINTMHEVEFIEMNDIEGLHKIMSDQVCAVIIEGIQGVGGIQVPSAEFTKAIESACEKFGAVFIVDEIQSGYGRTGKFFAHQHSDVAPHLITVAKGMGNGFPVAGVLIHPKIKAKHGMLGTTFGGNYLACAASIAVLDIIKNEQLVVNAASMGEYLIKELKTMEGVKEVRGKGLMIGIETEQNASVLRKKLLIEGKIFTGFSAQQNTIRLLPPLNTGTSEVEMFLEQFQKIIQNTLIIT